MNFDSIMPELKGKLSDGPERVGFILQKFEIVEVENICHDASEGFEVSGTALIKYKDAIATWHTHPEAPSALSANDFYGFRNYPQWFHLIIGTDGITSYYVENGRVLVDRQWQP